MRSAAVDLPTVYLNPGELFMTNEPVIVTTLLGSCVAITMFSGAHGYAAICHGMLARPGRQQPGEIEGAARFKYLSEAIPFMAARFQSLGIQPLTIEVKMFGGANVTTPADCLIPERGLIGSINVETARELLAAQSLGLKAVNVGGKVGRKLMFNTETGEVWHKHLGPAQMKGSL